MSASQPDLLPEPDLRDRSAWVQSYDRDGRLSVGVVMSYCGRYTIVRYLARPLERERYQAFRRHGPPPGEQGKWSPPSWSHCYDTAEQAREACWHHHQNEVAT